MARTSNITFGQVAAIADAMKAAGTRPTARAVRERIGSGSMGTIHKLLQQWTGKASAEDEETEAAELPSHIQNALMDFIGTEIATACEPINEELQTAKEAAAELATENERLESIIDQLQRDRDHAQHQHAAVSAQLNMTRENLTTANRERDNLQTANTDLLRELDRSQRQTEMMASYAPNLAKAQTALAAASEKGIEAERNAAVLAAQLAAKTEQANELIERLKTAESRANAMAEDAKQANNHYQACAARLEAAAREIESLRNPKAKAVAERIKQTVKAKPATVKKPDGNS